LFEQIAASLKQNPRKTLEELSQSLRVSKRTIKKTVRLATGGNFRSYREGVLMDRVKGFFAVQPGVAIKVLSIELGFKSPSSFARAVRRASGSCPGELRTVVAGGLPRAEKHATFYRAPGAGRLQRRSRKTAEITAKAWQWRAPRAALHKTSDDS